MAVESAELKARVKAHWEQEVCGSRWGDDPADRRNYFAQIEKSRYELDYMLKDFAHFEESKGKRVLEVGLGTGTDFVQWVRAGALAFGRDLTEAAVAVTKERVDLDGGHADVAVGDAEALDFPDNTFDIYYSWGVLHHTPNTEKAFAEAARVLKPGGSFRVMLYNYPSVGAVLVWLAQGPLRGRFVGLRGAYAAAMESPGTQMFSRSQSQELAAKYFRPDSIKIETYLGAGDLLTQRLSARYASPVWKVAQAVYPAWFVKHVLGHRFGTVLTLSATK
ncbi:MAG: class I SAM-dependent methyltransferase [Gemmatimonadaceae bacterium]